MTEDKTQAVTEDTKTAVRTFEAADAAYQSLFDTFQDEYQSALIQLDTAREERNAALDIAKKALRADAQAADYRSVKELRYGPFKVQKKWSGWYIVEMFVDLITQEGLYDAAVDSGVIRIKTEVDGNLAAEFLRSNSVEDKFKPCIDGKELTPAVTGPKPVVAFGGTEK